MRDDDSSEVIAKDILPALLNLTGNCIRGEERERNLGYMITLANGFAEAIRDNLGLELNPDAFDHDMHWVETVAKEAARDGVIPDDAWAGLLSHIVASVGYELYAMSCSQWKSEMKLHDILLRTAAIATAWTDHINNNKKNEES